MQKKTKIEKEEIKTRPESENEEWKNKYLRALADYHNLEKRTSEQIANQIKRGKKELLLKLLSVLDNIERAEVFVTDKGLALVKDELLKIVNNEGVFEIELLNKPYDPYLAECIEVGEGLEDDIVIAVLRKGYTLHGEVLRSAQVKVSKKVPVVNN